MDSVDVYAAVQAVDGVANHVMAHRWTAASGSARTLEYEAAFAVRQIEIGLTSFFSLVLGSTLTVFGVAMLLETRHPAWLGAAGLLGGLGTIAVGVEQAFNGFSGLALTMFVVVGLVDLIWAVVMGVLMWRLASQLAPDRDPSKRKLFESVGDSAAHQRTNELSQTRTGNSLS